MILLKITTTLTEQDYIALSYHIYYRKPPLKFISIVGVILVVTGIVLVVINFPAAWFILFFGTYLTAGMRLFIFYGAKRTWRNSSRLMETVVYEFSTDGLGIRGSSFAENITWQKIASITGTRDFIIVWVSKLVYHIIAGRDITDDERNLLRGIVKEHIGNRSRLK